MANYKLIVTDMDGTVLGANHRITEDNKKALIEAEKLGVKIIFATGRFHESAKYHIDFLKNTMPIISSNGSMIKDLTTDEILYSNIIENNICDEIINILNKYNLTYQIYTDKEILQNYKTEEEKENMIKFIKEMFFDTSDILFRKDLKKEIIDKNVLKINVMDLGNYEELTMARKELQEFQNVEVTSSWKNNIEVMAKGSTKGNALEFLANKLNIDKDDIIAFGDNYNDISMIEYAGMGVAMGNAEEEVKKIASYITCSNEESGVARALENLLLEKVVIV